MTLKRLLILLLVLMVLGTLIAWFWNYSRTPQGRARTVLCELRGDATGMRPWMMRNGMIKSEFTEVIEKAGQEVAPVQAPFVVNLADQVARKFESLGPGCAPALVEALGDSNTVARLGAAMALLRFGDSRAKPVLVDFLREPSQPPPQYPLVLPMSEPTMAAASLLDNGEPEGFAFLAAQVRKNGRLADETVKLLVSRKDPRTLELLLEKLADKHFQEKYLREVVIRGLGNLGDARAIPTVRKYLKDEDVDLRDAAQVAMERLAPKTPTSAAAQATRGE